ncbi:Probable Co/Zn/Cd efflux system membrane fusion protein [hydrothermal vent metagenome]|uniref:Probable Co/Zn/Cd efflux system membrane fusion protein n=1 Tax=hydrothermal vent metagenome TaxID=652676 RepID=A0A3B1AUS8_9ZZZZ
MKIKFYVYILILFACLNVFTLAHAENDHDGHASVEKHSEHEGGEHDEEGVIQLTPVQMKMAGIKVMTLQNQPVSRFLQAPGEVNFNAYKTVKITPRIAAQILGRSVKLGDEVKKGQKLLTLSSVEMAEAQGDYLVAHREWLRVKKLGRSVVSERRYTEAKVKWELSRGRIQAYGMTLTQINDLQKNKDSILANGVFQLLASQAGRVLRDNFITGERVEAGQELMMIADESVMWVDARVTPNDAGKISIGSEALILVNGEKIPAKVSQINHALNEITRTLSVRIEVPNTEDHLHPGMFVSARIATTDKARALTVPEAAVLRSPDGDWQVLVEQDEVGEFKAIEIKLERVSEGQAVISGINPGVRVVIEGAFFVQSELAKSGFSVHNH